MAEKLDISVSLLSSVGIGNKFVPAGMEAKIIELYALDQETAELLRKEADACRTSFTIKLSDPLSREIAGMFSITIDSLSQQDLAELKGLLEKLAKRCVL